MSLKGEPLPPAGHLPPFLVPPSLRQHNLATATSAGGGINPSSTPTGSSSVKSGDLNSPLAAATFEDKRRENFNKGQAELERRRQSLIEQQKKEDEERKRKEKEEAEAREKQKQDMERQRLAEWENQRKAELVQHRQREQEKVLELRAKKEHIDSELEKVREKVTTLTNGISETRTGVTDVKCFIDGMRTSRDAKMKDMSDIKARLKDQNQRLLQVTQEKAKLEAKNKARKAKLDAAGEGSEELTEFEVKKAANEKHVMELKEKLAQVKMREEEVKVKHESEKKALEEHKEKLKSIIAACKELYDNFDEKRREVKAEKAKRIRELTDPDHAWGGGGKEDEEEKVLSSATSDGYVEYRAIYDFESSNPDELPFSKGDLIMVHSGQPHEPGWLGGELNGKVGWFPEAYVERNLSQHQMEGQLQTIVEETPVMGDGGEMCIALYPYNSEEAGDLVFEAGSKIKVLKKDGDWWTGETGGKIGVFPYNYVELVASTSAGDDQHEGGKGGGKKSEIATVVAPYTATSKEQISLQRGQMILVRKKTSTGWWQGELQGGKGKKRQLGWFPATYVKVLGSGEDKNETHIIEQPQQQTSALGGTVPQKFKALFPYSGLREDELSFEADDIITLISKVEEVWWKGELNGRTGLFPANYVEEIPYP